MAKLAVAIAEHTDARPLVLRGCVEPSRMVKILDQEFIRDSNKEQHCLNLTKQINDVLNRKGNPEELQKSLQKFLEELTIPKMARG